MTKADLKISFWQFPITLKFVVIWICFLSLFYILRLLVNLIRLEIDILSVIGFWVYLALANGLINRDNSARIWTSVVVGIGSLIRVVFLVSMVFSLSLGYNLAYLSQSQKILLLFLNLVFNVIILDILLRPSTKTYFSHLPSQSTLQETT